MSESVESVNKDLRALAHELSDKELGRALRGALRQAAGIVRRQAARNVRSSGVRNAGSLAKNILTAAPYGRDKLGFRVYLSNRARKAMHMNRRGVLKPVLFWLEDGTTSRGVRKAGPIGALDAAERSTASEAESRIGEMFDKQVEKRLKKHGFI